MGIVCPGDGVDQVGQQRARAGEQDVDGFHGSVPLICKGPVKRRKNISLVSVYQKQSSFAIKTDGSPRKLHERYCFFRTEPSYWRGPDHLDDRKGCLSGQAQSDCESKTLFQKQKRLTAHSSPTRAVNLLT